MPTVVAVERIAGGDSSTCSLFPPCTHQKSFKDEAEGGNSNERGSFIQEKRHCWQKVDQKKRAWPSSLGQRGRGARVDEKIKKERREIKKIFKMPIGGGRRGRRKKKKKWKLAASFRSFGLNRPRERSWKIEQRFCAKDKPSRPSGKKTLTLRIDL